MLGTGSAFPVQSYHTCFVLNDGPFEMLVDAGGGNLILDRLEQTGTDINDLTCIFLTHTHTDHILGAVWLMRAYINAHIRGRLTRRPLLLASSGTFSALMTICRLTLLPSHYEILSKIVNFIDISKHKTLTIGGRLLRFFDIGSCETEQYGFSVKMSDGKTLTFLGDDSLTERNATLCEHTDWCVCGAFCLYSQRDTFKPYEKHHHTVLDVARAAARARVPGLILVHAEDTDLDNRARTYADEARQIYDGKLIVPRDFDVITLD